MRWKTATALTLILACLALQPAQADPKGGKGGGRDHKVKPLGIPPGHLPPPGQCRIWYPGKPPGHQPPPGRCSALRREVPAGAWLLRRPKDRVEEVAVDVYHDTRPSTVLEVRLFDADSGAFLRFGVSR
ncbi:MAG TPA: hypothetical protein VJV23_05235 [Candidatus Polarisedimenticolia bacterium]|nr:hypothetical protein [Candidatus Polarisedimenticolia bacterium]